MLPSHTLPPCRSTLKTSTTCTGLTLLSLLCAVSPCRCTRASHCQCVAAVSGVLRGGGGLTHLTRGYSPVTWLVVANLGFTGLLVSWVMKFADSIMKVGSHCFGNVAVLLPLRVCHDPSNRAAHHRGRTSSAVTQGRRVSDEDALLPCGCVRRQWQCWVAMLASLTPLDLQPTTQQALRANAPASTI